MCKCCVGAVLAKRFNTTQQLAVESLTVMVSEHYEVEGQDHSDTNCTFKAEDSSRRACNVSSDLDISMTPRDEDEGCPPHPLATVLT